MSYFDNCKVKILNISGEDMPDSKYFSLPGISNSKLKLINPLEEGSPEKYLQGFDQSYNSSLQLGSATHCLFLQKNDYELSNYEGKPSAKLGVFIEAVYEFRQQGWSIKNSINMASQKTDYYNNKLTQTIIKKAIKKGLDYYLRLVRKEFTSDKEVIVLDKKQLETCKTCLKSINNNVTVKKFLSENIFEEKQFLNEIALFSDCEVTLPDGKIIPLKLKGKLDQVIIDPEAKIIYLNDLKTTSKPLEYFMGKVINGKCYDGVFESHHYFRQMQMYLLLLQKYVKEILNLKDYTYRVNMIVVETTGQNRCQVFPVSQAYIDEGKKELKELLCRVAYHQTYGFSTKFE